jgi:hypothetical protein
MLKLKTEYLHSGRNTIGLFRKPLADLPPYTPSEVIINAKKSFAKELMKGVAAGLAQNFTLRR